MPQTPLRWTLLVAACLVAAPSPGRAQQTVEYQEPPADGGFADASSGPERMRLALFGGVHLGGQAQQSSSFGDVSQQLGPAPTLGARLELPLGNAVVLGGFLDFVSIQGRNPPPGADHVSLVGAGLWIKLRMILDLQRSLIELYVGVPLGFSIWIPPSTAYDPEAGIVLGALAGAQAHITPRFAVFVETGFRFDYFKLSGSETSYFQGAVHGGLSLGF